jgi:hypothetical protein
MRHSAAQPTPLLIDDDVIRVFVGFRDSQGVTRLGYVDVAGENAAMTSGRGPPYRPKASPPSHTTRMPAGLPRVGCTHHPRTWVR